MNTPRRGQRVRIPYGRWATRTGTFVGEHVNPGGMKQQAQFYPIVDLEPRGKAQARRVRVLAVEPIEEDS